MWINYQSVKSVTFETGIEKKLQVFFIGVNFKSRVVYEKMDIFWNFFGPTFGQKKTNFLHFEKSFGRENYHTHRAEDAESFPENRMELALLYVEIFGKKSIF